MLRYTGREFAPHFASAIRSLRGSGIDDLVTEKRLDVLGEKISAELGASSAGTEDSLIRPLSKSALRSKRKREEKMNSKAV